MKLLKIGKDKPELLYEHFDYWSQLMTSRTFIKFRSNTHRMTLLTMNSLVIR